MTTAADRWGQALGAWAIPQDILDRAPQSPWHFPPALFARAAERALGEEEATPSRRRATEALPNGGTVLDVGVGVGAASLPLAPPASRVIGVDPSAGMLAAFAEEAERRGVRHVEVSGTWPDVADRVDVADVVVCHHVLYNVADLVPFAAALTDHARIRVVVEVTARHPQTNLNPLWKALHGIDRPSSPTAHDARAVLVEMGLDVGVEVFERGLHRDHADHREMVAFTRRRLCVGPERDGEIEALLGPASAQPPRRLVTLWWHGDAPAEATSTMPW